MKSCMSQGTKQYIHHFSFSDLIKAKYKQCIKLFSLGMDLCAFNLSKFTKLDRI